MFAILGATGKVGGTTIAALRQAGVPVRAVVRDRSKAAHLVALGCEIAVADLQDVAALARAIGRTSAVQVICPVAAQADNAPAEMRRSIEAIGDAVDAVRPPTVLAISDYGAEVGAGTGVTMLFHALEERLRRTSSRLIFLRSAEHMQNWSRLIKVAAQTGRLPSLHHPLTKLFPTISAFDVGTIAADLLLSSEQGGASPLVVHVEGPRRYTPIDVASAMSTLLQRDVSAHELPRTEWGTALRRGGLSESYAQLVMDLYDAHNAGGIDAQDGVGEIRRGRTELVDALKPLVPAVSG
jgi:NAD(P)H dehydrogenase (quinone)